MNWEKVKIEDIKSDKKYALVGGPFGSDLSGKHYVDRGVPVIRGGNLPFNKKFDNQDFVFVSEEKADKLKSNLAHPGDIVFTQRGTLGQVGIVPFGEYDRYIISQSQMKLTINASKADPLFVFYYFRTEECVKRIENLALSSGVPHINLGILQKFQIQLPPLPTQKKIASILSAYEDLIENNNQRIKLLEEMAEEIYKEWFVRLRFPGYQKTKFFDQEGKKVEHGTPGALPEGWGKKAIKEFVDIISGYAFKSETFAKEGKYKLVTIKNVQDGYFVKENTDYIQVLPNKIKKEIYLKDKDILLSLTGNIGRICLVYGEDYLLNQRVAKLKPKSASYFEYVYLLFRSDILRKKLENYANGAAQQNLSPVDTMELAFITPNDYLIKKFSRLTSSFFDEIIILYKKNQILQETRDLLLPRLISGKLNVEDLEMNKGENHPVAAEPVAEYNS